MKVLPMVLAGVTALAAAGEITTSVRAGNEFAERMHALDGAPLSSPELRLSRVQVQRGLFHSSATAELVLDQPAAVLRLPLRVQAGQGLLPDGSALRVDITPDLAQAAQLRQLASELHDPQPMLAHVEVGLSGQIRRIDVSLAPVHGGLASENLQIDWDGASMHLQARDFFGANSVLGESDGSLRWTPMRITPLGATPEQAAAARIEIGALSETFEERGRYTNATGHFTMNMGPTVMPLRDGELRIDGMQASAHYGMHRREDLHPDNPSALPAGIIALKDLQLAATLSKPVAGTIHVNANLRAAEPPAAASGPAATASQPRPPSGREMLAQASGSLQLRATSALFGQDLQPLLRRCLERGWVSLQGADVVTTIAFDQGRVTANGKALEP